ncbi:MAG TPA: PIN domain-containing protein [Chloroflexi bacterium]|nr:PIN domain-containing protein [Chloroflexota bacterium]
MSSAYLPPVCLDASFLVQMVLHGEFVDCAAALWREWHVTNRELIAPSLIYYEINNAVYRYVKQGSLSLADGQLVLENVFSFSITVYQDFELPRNALKIAERFKLPAAYDAHYLALAQRFQADFWTADRRLFNTVQEFLPWVHWLGNTTR